MMKKGNKLGVQDVFLTNESSPQNTQNRIQAISLFSNDNQLLKTKQQIFSMDTIGNIPQGDKQGMEQVNMEGDYIEMQNSAKISNIRMLEDKNINNILSNNQYTSVNISNDIQINLPQLDFSLKDKMKQISFSNSNGVQSKQYIQDNISFKDNLEDVQKKQESSNKNNTQELEFERSKNEKISTKSMSYSISSLGEDYFKQDQESKLREQLNRAQADITAFKSYFVKFRWCQFIEFCFYHVLFYILFGPLSSLIIRFFGKSLPNNLLFSMPSMSLFYQTLFFLFTFLTYTLYFLMDCPHIYFQGEVMIEIAVIISRCMVIAFKYATYDPVKIQVIKHTKLTLKDIYSDFYLVDWAAQFDRIIHDETYFGLRVFDIDPSMFYVDFMIDPDNQTMKNAKQYVEDLKKWHMSKSQQFQPPNINEKEGKGNSIFGYSIMKEFSIVFKNKNKFIYDYVYYFCQGYGIYRALIPIAFRIIEGQYPNYYNWQEFIIMLGVAWNTRQIYYYSLYQLMSGFLDIKRKVFQQNQLAFMMAPRKLRNLDCFKIYPTINIFKMSTLKGWHLIRQVCLEYGKSYFIRVQALFSTFFLITFAQLALLLLSVFKIVVLEKCMIAIIVSDVLIFLVIILSLCYYCAKANSMFKVHENILKGNKSIISDLYRNRHKYFIENGKSSNYIYNKGIQKIKEEVAHLPCNDPISYILELIRDYEDQIEDIQFDSENNPVTILGVKVTFGLIQSIILTVAGLLITLIANFLKTNI